MKHNINPNNDGLDPSEEHFKKKVDAYDDEIDEYFPLESSEPPHY